MGSSKSVPEGSWLTSQKYDLETLRHFDTGWGQQIWATVLWSFYFEGGSIHFGVFVLGLEWPFCPGDSDMLWQSLWWINFVDVSSLISSQLVVSCFDLEADFKFRTSHFSTKPNHHQHMFVLISKQIQQNFGLQQIIIYQTSLSCIISILHIMLDTYLFRAHLFFQRNINTTVLFGLWVVGSTGVGLTSWKTMPSTWKCQ